MSTYPVDVKAVEKSTVATHDIFDGPARIVGLYINKEPSLAQGTVVLKDNTTAVAEFTVRATNNTNGAGLTVDGANATFNYASTGDKWTMNKPLDITGTLAVSSTSAFTGAITASGGFANTTFDGGTF